MGMDISFKFDPEVIIGADTLSMAGTVASRHGSRIMVAADHGLDSHTVNRLKNILEDSSSSHLFLVGCTSRSTPKLFAQPTAFPTFRYLEGITAINSLFYVYIFYLLCPSDVQIFFLPAFIS